MNARVRCIPLFTADEADAAHEAWGLNCGPGAIAAICGLTLDALRPQMGDFEQKGYTNPTLMWDVLNRIGVKWRLVRQPKDWPDYGLARVQWEGPWTEPGVPIRARYRHTHWVGAMRSTNDVGIFDINAMGNGTGWCVLQDWVDSLVPWLLDACEPKANGCWHLTHVAEIR